MANYCTDDERSIRGHKLILSTWFDKWCGSNLNDVDIIDLSDLDYSTAVTMIKWIYTDIFETKDVDVYFLEELLKATVKYKLDNLNERCQKALVDFIDRTNCRRFYQTADEISASIIKNHCSKFLSQTELKGQEDEEITNDVIPTTISDDLMVFDENIIPYKCHLCTKRFDEEKKLNFHIDWHTRKKPYSCKYCDKSFNRPIGLKEHTRSHTGEKPFQCDVCDRSFSVNSSLKSHKRIHDKIIYYSCDTCGKGFKTNGALRSHVMNKHTGVRPYRCKLCDKGYTQKGNLKKHIYMMHTGDKTLPKKKVLYECEVCKKKLCSKSGLKCHMRTHTGERPYPCQLCDKAFRLGTTLKKHYKSHERLARIAEKEAEKVKKRLKRQAKKEAKIKREAKMKEAARIKEARIEEA
ncbi:zinc finger protein 486 isoform X2 [Patella vulgata]|uniref:zinc finger protein 486 isoform X2 n=1 Tax=Patella vulgata TaxID=6465 RepID=UPI0024A88B26|nr:zinc finger protein 486 isoform X2 [Patella vulgata]XP_055957404.1 zinc finger protein 486 isoform X2 [Patella vulgata]